MQLLVSILCDCWLLLYAIAGFYYMQFKNSKWFKSQVKSDLSVCPQVCFDAPFCVHTLYESMINTQNDT